MEKRSMMLILTTSLCTVLGIENHILRKEKKEKKSRNR
jgi:hypothetical protein